MRALTIVLLATLPTFARAEYRAFELVIRAADGRERIEVSNLNPSEYRRFYPLPFGAQVGYRATWRCRGNTSWHLPICPNPNAVSTTGP